MRCENCGCSCDEDKTINEVLREELHKIRVSLDSCLKKVLEREDDYEDEIEGCDTVGQLAISELIINIQQARMWAGKLIGSLDDELPADYPKDEAK